MKIAALVTLLSLPLIAIGQYSVSSGWGPIFPLPSDGVVSVVSNVGTLSKVESFDAAGSRGEVASLPSGLTGDYGDYALLGQELYFIPTFWVDYDVVADAGLNLLKFGSDSVSLVYDGSFQYANLVAEKTIGVGSTSGNVIVTEGDSIHIVSTSGMLINSVALPAVYGEIEAVDLSGSIISAEYVLIGKRTFFQNSDILYLDTLGQVINTESFISNPLKTWSMAGEAISFFEEGYMVIGSGNLIPYPASLDTIVAAYDAFDVAVVRNDEGQYFSFTPDDGFVALGNPKDINLSFIIKRTEGWYTQVSSILTFNPDSLDVPPVNPLEFTFIADSAVLRVEVGNSPDFPRTHYSVSYTLNLKNISDEDVSSASVEVLGVPGSYDPFDPLSATSFVSVGSISAGETVSTSGVHTYSLPGEFPTARAGLQACISRVSDVPILGGEPVCRQAITDQVSNTKNYGVFQGSTFKVFPNPIKRHFTLETDKQIQAVHLFNSTGQLVQEFEGEVSQTYQVQTSTTAGFYMLQITYTTGEIEKTKVLVGQ